MMPEANNAFDDAVCRVTAGLSRPRADRIIAASKRGFFNGRDNRTERSVWRAWTKLCNLTLTPDVKVIERNRYGCVSFDLAHTFTVLPPSVVAMLRRSFRRFDKFGRAYIHHNHGYLNDVPLESANEVARAFVNACRLHSVQREGS